MGKPTDGQRAIIWHVVGWEGIGYWSQICGSWSYSGNLYPPDQIVAWTGLEEALAAPDLLAACKRALSSAPRDTMPELHRVLSVAIAKAEAE